MWLELLEAFLKAAFVFGAALTAVPVLVWLERKACAWIQERTGPNRVGPYGLFQPIIDAVKLIFKEDIIPADAHRVLFVLAPTLELITVSLALAVIPFGDTLRIPFTDHVVTLIAADVGVGVLWIFAMASLGVYGIILAGWSSSNHFSFIGGLRASAQIISYELAMGFAVLSVLIHTGGLRLRDVVFAQDFIWWNALTMPFAFVIFFVAIFAETNRLPFDLPEAEAELVGGFHTEYSSMKFSLFFMAEYVSMVSMSALLVTLFLGGWRLPGVYRLLEGLGFGRDPIHPVYGFVDIGIFVAKVGLILFFFIWVRWTLPRFRYDQLMSLGWKVMLPLALVQVVAASVWRLFGWKPYLVCQVVMAVVTLIVLSRPRELPTDTRVPTSRLGEAQP